MQDLQWVSAYTYTLGPVQEHFSGGGHLPLYTCTCARRGGGAFTPVHVHLCRNISQGEGAFTPIHLHLCKKGGIYPCTCVPVQEHFSRGWVFTPYFTVHVIVGSRMSFYVCTLNCWCLLSTLCHPGLSVHACPGCEVQSVLK